MRGQTTTTAVSTSTGGCCCRARSPLLAAVAAALALAINAFLAAALMRLRLTPTSTATTWPTSWRSSSPPPVAVGLCSRPAGPGLGSPFCEPHADPATLVRESTPPTVTARSAAPALAHSPPSQQPAQRLPNPCDDVATGLPITLHVFAWRRAQSLRRLLDSLLAADYFSPGLGAAVPLVLHLDGGWSPAVGALADTLLWPHGPKAVVRSQVHVGLRRMMLDAWRPVTDSELAIFLEDDVEVSPLFFRYASWCANSFLVPTGTPHESSPPPLSSGVIGCSLYTPRVDEISTANRDPALPPAWRPADTLAGKPGMFLFQLPCSWGAVYQGGAWRRFIDYFRRALQRDDEDGEGSRGDVVPMSRSNSWRNSWKKYLIEHMYAEGLTLLYPSLPNETSFSTNHYEDGVHSVPDGWRRTVAPVDRLRAVPDERFRVPLVAREHEAEVFARLRSLWCDAGVEKLPEDEMVTAAVGGRMRLPPSVDLWHRPVAAVVPRADPPRLLPSLGDGFAKAVNDQEILSPKS
ncbi:hypothetical protein HK405_009486 [Cladochytrium tenue]|nr:hypothetical protein HK405_009486 [Cladochytrium tenue]